MCTLAVALHQHPSYPVVLAANRDEALDRPASGPQLWIRQSAFIAPKDERAGGTWLGLNEHGLFVGITNRFGAPNHNGRTSRGTLVVEALAARSVEALHRTLCALPSDRFNAFHLFYADLTGAGGVTWSDGTQIRQEELGAGLHIITERSYGAADVPRAARIRAAWPAADERPDAMPDVSALQRLMSVHVEEDPLAATCIHVPSFNYGTRSSTVLLLHSELRRSRWYSAEGPPCTTPYVDVSSLVQRLHTR